MPAEECCVFLLKKSLVVSVPKINRKFSVSFFDVLYV